VSDAVSGPENLLDLIENLLQTIGNLSGLQAALLIARNLDIASDSRTFAKLFGIEHALVLRELNTLQPGRAVGDHKAGPTLAAQSFRSGND